MGLPRPVGDVGLCGPLSAVRTEESRVAVPDNEKFSANENFSA
ncbi:hypothetical protein T261_00138 [Streptomyces lydicus]|nr:hypothetical protein T261_00138 [Streptomyces lydicus]